MSLERILPVIKRLAGRAEGMSNADLCKAENLTASAARAYIASSMQTGEIYKGQAEGKHPRYFGTKAEAEAFGSAASPQVQLDAVGIAKAAVREMRADQVRSSLNLAALVGVSDEAIDQALAPLVEGRRLIRIAVLRGGVSMFDYRFSAAWKPQESDFALCTAAGAGTAPQATLSPVSAPAPKAVPAAAKAPEAPAAPVALPSAPKPAGAPKSPTPAAPAAPASMPTLENWLRRPAELGFALTPEEPAPRGDDDSEEPFTILADANMVCALNSRGELAIDMGKSGVLKFKPAEALSIKRFLENTSVLEELAGRGAL